MNLGRPVLRATYPGLAPIEVEHGTTVRLTGPNGCGKTTVLRALAGMTPHVDVQARVHGENPTGWTARRLRQEIAYVPQDARDRLIGLTVAGEARLRGRTSHDLRDVSRLSTGEAARVAIDMLDAPVWLLDEPASHLDDEALAKLRARMAAHDGTILYTDHTQRIGLGTELQLAPGHRACLDWPAPSGPAQLRAPAQFQHVALPPVAFGGGIHVLTGANGSGKSTLLRILAGLDGEATLSGVPVQPGMASYLGPEPWPHLVAERVGDLAPPGPLVPAAWADRHPWTLSTGEAQRVALARALARPGPLLLDEPDAHLDGRALEALADQLAARGGITVLASHDPATVAAGKEVPL